MIDLFSPEPMPEGAELRYIPDGNIVLFLPDARVGAEPLKRWRLRNYAVELPAGGVYLARDEADKVLAGYQASKRQMQFDWPHCPDRVFEIYRHNKTIFVTFDRYRYGDHRIFWEVLA